MNAIILHGTGCKPSSFWYPSVKKHLQKLGYQVYVPSLPLPDEPDVNVQMPYVMENCRIDKETILIGHSSGCPLILAVLQNSRVKIRKAILVAGFIKPLDDIEISKLPLLDRYDWKKIRSKSEDFIFINSDDDPWGCNDKHGKMMFNKLGGTQIVLHGQGHMGSDKFKQPYKRFRLLEKLLEP